MVYNARATGGKFQVATEVVFKTVLATEGPKENSSSWAA